MADGDTIKTVLDNPDDEREVVLNRARLYHDRRDFYIQYGDTGMRDDYPAPPRLPETYPRLIHLSARIG